LQDFNYQPGRVKELPDALQSILAANSSGAYEVETMMMTKKKD